MWKQEDYTCPTRWLLKKVFYYFRVVIVLLGKCHSKWPFLRPIEWSEHCSSLPKGLDSWLDFRHGQKEERACVGYYLTWSWPKWGNRRLTDSYKRTIRVLCCLNPSNDKDIKRQGQGRAPEGTGDGKSYEKSRVWKKQCKNGYHFFSVDPHPGEGPSVTSLRGSPSNHAE